MVAVRVCRIVRETPAAITAVFAEQGEVKRHITAEIKPVVGVIVLEGRLHAGMTVHQNLVGQIGGAATGGGMRPGLIKVAAAGQLPRCRRRDPLLPVGLVHRIGSNLAFYVLHHCAQELIGGFVGFRVVGREVSLAGNGPDIVFR